MDNDTDLGQARRDQQGGHECLSREEAAMRLYLETMVADGYGLERMDPDDGMTEISIDEAIEHLRGEIKTIWVTKTTRVGDDYSSNCFQITGDL